MSDDSNRAIHLTPEPVLDDRHYNPDERELAFFKSQTGIEDEEDLKKHILAVQAAALRISRLPAYESVLHLGKTNTTDVLLDVGCCFGSDARNAIADGFPMERVVATDVMPQFWDLGYTLFRDKERRSIAFVEGDIFDLSHLTPSDPIYDTALREGFPPVLRTLTSLNPLRGYVCAINASLFFHLFDEDGQLLVARGLAGLLSPEPGSLILGSHIALPQKGQRPPDPLHGGFSMFCHSPGSWQAMWETVFKPGTIRVDEVLKEHSSPDGHMPVHMLKWSVTRL